jgi:hypothetical protein
MGCILFRMRRLWHRFSPIHGQKLYQHLIPTQLMPTSYAISLHREFVTPIRVAAHDYIVARRALARACSKRNVNVLSFSELSPGTGTLFYVKDVVKKGVSRWHIGYIADADDNLQQSGETGTVEAADWNIQLMSMSSFLQRLFEIETFDSDVSNQLLAKKRYWSLQGCAGARIWDYEWLIGLRGCPQKEANSVRNGRQSCRTSRGEAESLRNRRLSRVEQRLLEMAFDAVGSKEFPARDLSFLPPWMIEKAVETEEQTFMNIVEESSCAQARPHANVFSTFSFLS